MHIERIINETFLAAVEHYEEVDSTNTVALARGESSEIALPRLIVADRQTAGRGRGSNYWWTGPGALACSLLLNPRDLLESSAGVTLTNAELHRRTPLIALAAGLAVVEAVETDLAELRVGIHWPNDVFVDAHKLAGILVESPRADRCVVGIGINNGNSSAAAPENLRNRVVALCDLLGHPVDRTDLLLRLMRRLEQWLGHVITQPYSVGREAHARCLQRGESLTVESAGEIVEGRCQGITDDGALVLQTPAGQRGIYSGTIRQ